MRDIYFLMYLGFQGAVCPGSQFGEAGYAYSQLSEHQSFSPVLLFKSKYQLFESVCKGYTLKIKLTFSPPYSDI